MSRFPVQIAGVDLEIESRGWRRPRLLRGGEEVPRDRWENYVVTDDQGREHRPELGYNQLHMSPVLYDSDQHTATLVAPLPKSTLALLLVTLVLSVLLGGALGLILVSVTQRFTVNLWRQADRAAGRVALLALAWLVLIGLAALQVVRLLT
ncbi:hypothetical protein LWF15_07510 [Kineosporia rhizophila]|uniref:hypothetical protein n=1 Tax=Kineosporia TaxID=49184 RepID=UPI001E6292D2|nr:MULTISPECIES: hypothetical protein [Kineosporia]MCE0535353.1 hypothetical protein [Kineosporia rhizophila]